MPGVQLLPSARPDPYAGANTQAFTKILQTLGHFEGLRRKEMLNTDILSVLSRGGGVEDIAGVVQAHQQPQFDTGVRGLLQRIAAPFAPQPGAGITDAMTKGTLESAFKTISPSQMMSAERWRKYQEAVASGDEETAKRLLSSALVNFNVPTGQKLLTDAERKARAAKEHAEAMALSTSMVNSARQSVKSIIKDAPTKGWTKAWGVGQYDYSRSALTELYKHYQIGTQYSSKTATNRKVLDGLWDNQIKVYNKVGHKNVIGTDEFDWDPKDSKVQELRGDYDYEAAVAGGASPDETGHWPSQFKKEGSPEQFVDGLDTKTASLEDVIATYTSLAREELGVGATPKQIAERAKKLAKSRGWKIE